MCVGSTPAIPTTVPTNKGSKMKVRQIVKDSMGNHFKVVKPPGDGHVVVESVVTKQRYVAPLDQVEVVPGLSAVS